MNNRPETIDRVAAAAWPMERLGEAISTFSPGRQHAPPGWSVSRPRDRSDFEVNRWIERIVAGAGMETDRLFAALTELPALLRGTGPLILQLPCEDSPTGEPRFLVVLRGRGRTVTVSSPEGRQLQLPSVDVIAALRRPFDAAVQPALDRIATRLNLSPRAQRALADDQLGDVRFRGCWVLQSPASAPLPQSLRASGAPVRLGLFAAAYAAQYLLFVASWWLLGHALLSGSVDRGLILGWALLLLTLIPLRLTATWQQGRAASALGAWLRRRLLRGALSIDRQVIRQRGVGQLFGLVVESAAVESLALSGGLTAACAAIELLVAGFILGQGLGWFLPLLLAAWVAATALLTFRFWRRRQQWTAARVHLSEQLLEAMVGHRTRLVQQLEATQREADDIRLDRYLQQSRAMDEASVWLSALMPRGWIVIAIAALTPALVEGRSATALGIALGGILLAYRGLQRLSGGLSSLSGAVIAGRSVSDLAGAAERTAPQGITGATSSQRSSQDGVAAQLRDVTFRYRDHGEPVLRATTLTVQRGDHLLIEGPSGSGKTTLAAVAAGLTKPESGLVLVGGLDRASVGADGWREKVVMAPQPNDNYLITGSLAFNLLMGRQWPPERADLDSAEAVCRELGLGELLDRLPAGLNQIVGETGWQLSQGERTRVFLARALLQRPELLILDESFGGLDWENVDRAMRCVHERAATVLAIAHP